MACRVLYHCPCSTDFTGSYGPQIPSSSSHELAALYFCEECDSIRCNLCTTRDLSAFYCPHCLFDVPLASVKQEKAKCPRNCFACPICTTTLNVVSSDIGGQGGDSTTTDQQHWDPRSPEASMGVPPYYLACPTCRWDSLEIGLTFEKPTGLTLQLQRQEDASADVIEFKNLRSHLESFLRVSDTPTAVLAARSSKLLRDVPSLANDPHFAPNRREHNRKARGNMFKDEQMPDYEASMSWDVGRDKRRTKGMYTGAEEGKALGYIGRRHQDDMEQLLLRDTDTDVNSLSQTWSQPHEPSMFTSRLQPKRISLWTKQTKRCPACRHIIIRPDTKPTSHRFKIRLLALQHLPEIQIRLASGVGGGVKHEKRGPGSVVASAIGRRRAAPVDLESLQGGRSYSFEASFLNPLDEAVTVKLHISRGTTDVDGESVVDGDDDKGLRRKPQPWTVTPTTSTFPVNAFNAVWELEEEDDDEDRFDLGKDDLAIEDDEDENLFGRGAGAGTGLAGRGPSRKKRGVLRQRGHETVIGLELKLENDVRGDIEFPLQVTFSHRLDAEKSSNPARAMDSSHRSFSFWTFIRLGCAGQSANAVSPASRRLASAMMIPQPSVAGAHGDTGRSVPHTGLDSGASSASSTLTVEQRRQMLDKKRSIMGLHDAASPTAQTPPL